MTEDTGWGDEETGAKMSDSTPATNKGAAAEPDAPTPSAEQKQPQVRLAAVNLTDSFTIPDLGGITIGKDTWQSVESDWLDEIQTAARLNGVELEVKED